MKHPRGIVALLILCSSFACKSAPATRGDGAAVAPGAQGAASASPKVEVTPSPSAPASAALGAPDEPTFDDFPSVVSPVASPKESLPAGIALEPTAPKLEVAPPKALPKAEPKPEKALARTEPKVEKPAKVGKSDTAEEKKEEKPARVIPETPELPARQNPAIEETVNCSRTVRATVGQLVEVPYRGAGWVFLGERSSQKGLPYDSRRLDSDGQSFIFKASAPGSFDLQFYKRDFIEDYLINDTVRVVISEPEGATQLGGFSAPIDRGRVVAEPRWPLAPVAPAPTAASTSTASLPAASATPSASATPAATAAPSASATPSATAAPAAAAAPSASATKPATVPASAPKVARPTVPSVPQAPAPAAAPAAAKASAPQSALVAAVPVSGPTVPTAALAPTPAEAPVVLDASAPPDAWMAKARKDMESGNTASALATLDAFSALYPQGSDEALWLYGHILESNGPGKDIKRALDFYEKLIDAYPQSPRYDEAKKRVAWLKRFYFEIR